jgi:hypothetical protein
LLVYDASCFFRVLVLIALSFSPLRMGLVDGISSGRQRVWQLACHTKEKYLTSCQQESSSIPGNRAASNDTPFFAPVGQNTTARFVKRTRVSREQNDPPAPRSEFGLWTLRAAI